MVDAHAVLFIFSTYHISMPFFAAGCYAWWYSVDPNTVVKECVAFTMLFSVMVFLTVISWVFRREFMYYIMKMWFTWMDSVWIVFPFVNFPEPILSPTIEPLINYPYINRLHDAPISVRLGQVLEWDARMQGKSTYSFETIIRKPTLPIADDAIEIPML
jgi:hypothetical protein